MSITTSIPTGATEPDAVEAVRELAATDVSGCDRVELDRVVALGRRVRGFLDCVDVQVARRSDRLADQGHGDPAVVVLADGGRRPARDARTAATRAGLCDQLPTLETALADGTVTGAHIDAVAHLAARLDEQAQARFGEITEALVADATHQPISTFERACRTLRDQLSIDDGVERFERQRANTNLRRWINRTTGMYHLHGELDPQSGATLFGAIDATPQPSANTPTTAAPPVSGCRSNASKHKRWWNWSPEPAPLTAGYPKCRY